MTLSYMKLKKNLAGHCVVLVFEGFEERVGERVFRKCFATNQLLFALPATTLSEKNSPHCVPPPETTPAVQLRHSATAVKEGW